MKKRVLALFLTLIACLALLPTVAFAASDGFVIEDGVLTDYTGPGGNVVIPEGVTVIGDWVFSNCTSLTGVIIPSSVTSIRTWAFSDCTSLSSVIIPSSVTYIGPYAFSGCKNLTSVTIPSSVTMIWCGAFFGCTGLKDVFYTGNETQWEEIEAATGYGPNFSDFKVDLTSATIHYNSSMPQQPTTPDKSTLPVEATAAPTNDALTMDGKAYVPAAYKIDGANCFKLRDVAMMLNGTKGQFSIDYDNEKKIIVITTGQPYQPTGGELAGAPTGSALASYSNDAVYINGVQADLVAYKIDGANYYGIRDLGRKLGFNVGWTAERGMFLESDKPYSDAD